MSTERYPSINPGETLGAGSIADEFPDETTAELSRRIAPRAQPQRNRASSLLLAGASICALADSEDFDERVIDMRRLAARSHDSDEAKRLTVEVELATMIQAGAVDEFAIRKSGMISVDLKDGSIRLRGDSDRITSIKGVKLPMKVPKFDPSQPSAESFFAEGESDEKSEADNDDRGAFGSLLFPGEDETAG